MQLKTIDVDGVVYGELQDGKPVYIHDDGKVVPFDYSATLGTISRLNGEAKANREAKQAAEEKLKQFEGIEDPDAARDALSTVSSLNAGELLKAGKVDEIKAQAEKAYKERETALRKEFEPVIVERDQLKGALNKEIIGGSFNRSKFIAEKLAIPADLVEAKFGNAFSLEDGKVIAKDASGNRIYSRERPGEIATFDEALESIVDSYSHRDTILKGSGASGGGAGGSNQAALVGGKRPITRAAFDALDPAAQAAAARENTIVD